MSHTDVVNILIFRGGALGDFLLTLPAITAVQNRWPEAKITLVTRPAYGELMLAFQLVYEVRNLESADMALLFSPQESLPSHLRTWLGEFDVVFAWMQDADGHFKRHLSEITQAIVSIFDPVLRPKLPHASMQLSRGLNALDIPVGESPPPLFHGNGFRENIPPHTIAIHPGSGSLTKNWPASSWAEIILEIHRSHPQFTILLIGGEADDLVISQLRQRLQGSQVPLLEAICWPLSKLARVLTQCEFYIGHDTGVSHLAAACGVPSLLLFGPTDPAIWSPPFQQVQVIKGNLSELPIAQVLKAMEALPLSSIPPANAHRISTARLLII